ncbi:MAG TPA: glycoside hydrolase family 125 protein [Anaerolineae bacterium]
MQITLDLPKNRLDPDRAYKPLDFGNGLLAGSVAPHGRLLSLNTYHPKYGYVTLSAVAPFPDDQRTDQAAVRAYRATLASPGAPAFGLRLPASALSLRPDVYLLAGAMPHSHWHTPSLDVEVSTWAPHLDGQPVPGAYQHWRFTNPHDRPIVWDYAWEGPLALSRASYTQLTESGDLPMPAPALRLAFDGRELSIVAPELGAAAVILGLPPGPSWQQEGEGSLPMANSGRLSVTPGHPTTLTFIYALGQTLEQARRLASQLASRAVEDSLTDTLETRQKRSTLIPSPPVDEPALNLVPSPRRKGRRSPVAGHRSDLLQRAHTYIWDCCTLPIGEGICLLTDHQLLPLSWTRDAYFLIQGLQATGNPAVPELTRRHLLWLFETAERPDGYWGRAYLANGRPKDSVFQLDQQCYPLLELAEYAALTSDEVTVRRLLPHLAAVLKVLLARQAASAACLATEETPADDPLPLPYHFSSQILLWHTLRHLAILNSRWSFTTKDLSKLAEAVRAAVFAHFIAEHEGSRLFAYATDLQGNYHFYHDANDLPVALAPLWGFCPADDSRWQATMDFAFSPANRGGYYPGPVGGLGSVHTPGAWPLGDVQEYLYARLIGDLARAGVVLNRLATTACWDGALPEARDENDGAVRSRHWFAWPGAALVAALLHPEWRLEIRPLRQAQGRLFDSAQGKD